MSTDNKKISSPAPAAGTATVPAPPQTTTVVQQPQTLGAMLKRIDVVKRFEEMLGKKAPGFVSSILSLQKTNAQLATADPRSIISAAAIAASLDLPINPNLGYAYIVPYGNQAQFQMGWKGFVQLAQRSNQYRTINATEIYEGEIISHDRLTGQIEIDETKRTSDKIVGYLAYFRLLTGFEKVLFMTTEQVRAHGQKYSKSFSRAGTPWQVNFDAMALKTVVKLLLAKWGPMSIETQVFQKGLRFDQAVVTDRELSYADNPDNEPIDTEALDEGGATAPAPATAAVNASELFGEKK
jgi:recombination protein RecT